MRLTLWAAQISWKNTDKWSTSADTGAREMKSSSFDARLDDDNNGVDFMEISTIFAMSHDLVIETEPFDKVRIFRDEIDILH